MIDFNSIFNNKHSRAIYKFLNILQIFLHALLNLLESFYTTASVYKSHVHKLCTYIYTFDHFSSILLQCACACWCTLVNEFVVPLYIVMKLHLKTKKEKKRAACALWTIKLVRDYLYTIFFPRRDAEEYCILQVTNPRAPCIYIIKIS